jgi:hypothetical protein
MQEFDLQIDLGKRKADDSVSFDLGKRKADGHSVTISRWERAQADCACQCYVVTYRTIYDAQQNKMHVTLLVCTSVNMALRWNDGIIGCHQSSLGQLPDCMARSVQGEGRDSHNLFRSSIGLLFVDMA